MIHVRAARRSDVAGVAAIYDHAVLNGTGSFETEAPGPAEMAIRFDSLVAKSFPFLVAERDSDIVGFAYAGPFRTRQAFRFTVEDSVYVAAAARRSGVGTALLASLIDYAASAGFRQMVAVIGDARNTASVQLHKAHGFSEVGVLRNIGWKMERWLDAVIMQRGLGDPPSVA